MKDRTKVAYLRDMANDSNAPFIAIQETHLTAEILSAEIQINDYTLYRSDRTGGRTHGGCAVYCKDDLTVTEIFKYSNNCCEIQMLDMKELGIILINCYRPPGTPIQLFEEILIKCQDFIEKEAKSKILLLVGDFNFPFIEWPSRKIYSREQEHRASEKIQAGMLLDWTEQHFLEQFITTATRKGNILDLVFSNTPDLISQYSTIVNSNLSDHNILKINLNVSNQSKEKKKRKNPYPNKVYEYELLNAHEEDWIAYDALLSRLSEDFDEKSKDDNTAEKLDRFYNLLEKAVTVLFEKKESFKTKDEKKDRPKNKIPKNIRILMRKKTSLSKKIMASSSPTRTVRLLKLLETIENNLKTSYQTMRMKKEDEALKKIRKDPRYFYKFANSFSKVRNNIGPLINEKGETTKESYDMAEILKKQYESTFSTPDPEFNIDNLGDFFNSMEESEMNKSSTEADNCKKEDELNKRSNEKENEANKSGNDEENERNTEPAPDPASSASVGTNPPKLAEAHFNYMDIADAIDQLSSSSGPGPDGIPAILLKRSKITVALMLNNIFNHSMENSEIPDILKLGFICPILKPDSKREIAASWRPVNLTSHVIKTFERVLRKQIVNHLESNDLMDPDQHGSRQKRSCLSQLLEHHDEILKMLEDGVNVDVIYTDFAKAYEKIDHAQLLKKMKNQFGITGKLGKWIQNFLQDRKQQVLVEEITSQKSKVMSGSIQGSVLGPVLFLMYIQDISKGITAQIKIFVDDTKMKDVISEEKDVEKLQGELDKLFIWQDNNNMLFNGGKFQLLRYGINEDLKNSTLYFTDNTEHIIERFSSVRDLGVILSENGKFEDHLEKVSKKVRQKVGWICRSFQTRRTDVMKHLWKTLVQCHVDYCSQLYKPGQAQGLQMIERLFYNFTSKIPEIRDLDYWSRLQALKMYSQERRMERYRIIYIWKILKGLVPNCGVQLSLDNERLGRKVLIPSLKRNGRKAIQTLREQCFQINGARLFNCLPKQLRNINTCQEDFKEALDKYLSSVPDQPRIGSLIPQATDQLTGRQCNSLLAWTHDI